MAMSILFHCRRQDMESIDVNLLSISNCGQIETKNDIKTVMGEDTYAGALPDPHAGSPVCVFDFVFVSIYLQFDLRTKSLF